MNESINFWIGVGLIVLFGIIVALIWWAEIRDQRHHILLRSTRYNPYLNGNHGGSRVLKSSPLDKNDIPPPIHLKKEERNG